MTSTESIRQAATPGPFAGLAALLRGRLVRDYAAAVSGSAGRLIFSLLYFVLLANSLSIADFGLFATASAAGVMLSRILGFGFISALYRVSTVKQRLIGTFSAGFLFLAVLSLPALFGASWLAWRMFFPVTLPLAVFATVVAAEALFWRPTEVVVIVNNGMGRFGRAAALVILGTAFRAAAALGFATLAPHTIAIWGWFYLAANAAVLAVAVIGFHPRQRLRLKSRLYWRRLPDSLYVAGAEMLFYLQSELDKLLVLAIGGAEIAGLYAIVMRLVDLTAIPIRAFTMMLVQQMMRAPNLLASLKRRAGIEGGIFLISTVALGCLALMLHIVPTLLGKNVAEAAPLVALALLVPGLRNLVEYQAELLFARGQTLLRAMNLAVLTAVKGLLLVALFAAVSGTSQRLLGINGVFAGLYLVSVALTYSALRRPAKKI